MTAPSSFHAEMEADARAGRPNLDNVSDGEHDGPGTCTCTAITGDHTDADCLALAWETR